MAITVLGREMDYVFPFDIIRSICIVLFLLLESYGLEHHYPLVQ